MMDRLNTITRCLPAVMASIFFMTGCQSTRIVRMYNGPDVPADQLATLVAPWCISLRSVDGVPAPSTLADELRLLLKPGVHTVEARYVVLYPTGKSDTEKIVSDYITLTFTGEAGKIYTICSKDPKTLEATRKYAAHVSLWIEENRAGAAKGSAMEKPTAPVAMPTGAKSETAVASPSVENPDIQEQLLKLWEKSGEKDRKAFLDKIRRQYL